MSKLGAHSQQHVPLYNFSEAPLAGSTITQEGNETLVVTLD